MRIRVLAVAVLAVALPLVGTTLPASAEVQATPSTYTSAINVAGCAVAKSRTKDNRVLTLYNCGTALYGKLTKASPGDLVYMKNISGSTAGGSKVAKGKTSATTSQVSGRGWNVCVAVANRPGADWCA